ncbi:putative ABC-type antimicrobial peptide transport system, ATPase component [Vibrio nigripulchritudo MADA3029]|uniref:ABC transporter ATP-binding protein n=1 Tax=Vibrio nigripulchritudo TaxID=28173 RepID=UPI0003B1EE54|nr:ABC transporter ATP-binding protein [Vibrio nigripulchritudo]CCN47264.1 putative ABC-type antimicrobial peptide transport system, ATPase component [Vibrio nigripulchritudo MADA3020]CCN52532.1 putative ABC-type antimicrobial peptide transport system, ATPase component [Vibrio nigripulchritudo MADA3021]CCN60687.1 putative ABC-type antimicrobial peptide transport system, ATPase component [Vibrio nigripulchritudo MADA3029]
MIEFNQINKSYQLGTIDVPALKSATGTIEKGEMVALCGPSGSGKSTLLNVLGLLDTDYSGHIHFEGKPLPKTPKQAAEIRRYQMGFIFQKFNLVPVMTALENVMFPLKLNGHSRDQQREIAFSMLEKVGLGEYVHHRPDNLSGGQQQRVAIARALVNKPKLIIADEPTASLDSESATLVIDIMKSLGHEFGTTFVIATHDHRMAERCDRSIALFDGVIQKEALKWVS